MSFILDALKKSDQQRQRGATPTLRSVPFGGGETRRPLPMIYGVVALLLLAAGITIGWLQPWQTQPPAPVAPASGAPAVAAAPAVPPAAPPMPMESPATPLATNGSAVAPTQNPVALEELPLSLRQELPPMTISLHAYARKPEDRIVSINNQLLHEGGSPASGVILEQITPEGMVLSYRGYRFRRGVR